MTELEEDVKDVNVDAGDLPELKQNFDACDANGDGWITSSEFAGLLHSLCQELSDDEWLLAVELTDADGDGLISFEEAEKAEK